MQQKMHSPAGSTWAKSSEMFGRVAKLYHDLWGVGIALTLREGGGVPGAGDQHISSVVWIPHTTQSLSSAAGGPFGVEALLYVHNKRIEGQESLV